LGRYVAKVTGILPRQTAIEKPGVLPGNESETHQ